MCYRPGLQIEDRKLKGKLRYTERVVSEAQQAAAKVDEWLLPAEPGELEAEGMERTWRFSQADIVQVGGLLLCVRGGGGAGRASSCTGGLRMSAHRGRSGCRM